MDKKLTPKKNYLKKGLLYGLVGLGVIGLILAVSGSQNIANIDKIQGHD